MYKVKKLDLSAFMPKRAEMAFPVPTKTFLQLSPITNECSQTFFTLQANPLTSPLLTQNVFPKDIARSDITKLIVPQCHLQSLHEDVDKGVGLGGLKPPHFFKVHPI